MSSQHEMPGSAPPDRSLPEAEPVQDISNDLQELHLAPSPRKEAADSQAAVHPEAPPRQVSSNPSTPPRPTAFKVPVQLIKPGLELLKVSAKSARRVKPRKVWLETMSDKDRDGGNLGLELDLGGVSKQEVKLCWEKNGAGLGFGRSANYASVPLSRIRDMRFSSAGSPYRISLHLPPSVEPRWVTIIYAVPPPSNFLGSVTGGPAYKLVHFIATTAEDISLLRRTLESFRDGRLARGISETSAAPTSSTTQLCADAAEDKVVREAEVHQLCARLGMGLSSSEISLAFKTTAAPNDFLDFKAFQAFVQLLKRRTDVENIFSRCLAPGATGLTQEGWFTYMRTEQRSIEDDASLRRRFVKYADPATGTMLLDGFVSFLLSSDNAAIKDEADQDMQRPLSEYFISSSHNTYLIGSQFQGQSSVEGYIRALQQGCRSVEVDVWDGDNGEPAVTHGHTLTSKIPVRTVLQAIAQYAFLASPYPVILSVEVHCELQQQEKLVSILHETLGDRLVSKRLDEIEADNELDKLPSPAQLKGRFLLKAKNKFLTTGEGSLPISVSASDDSSSEPSSYSSSDGDFKSTRFYRAIRQLRGSDASDRPSISRNSSSSRSSIQQIPAASLAAPPNLLGSQLSASPPLLSPASANPLTTTQLPTSPRIKDMPMSQELAKLLVYTVGVKGRGFNKKESYPATHVVSLSESNLSKMLRDDATRQDFVSHNRTHLVRAYPRGRRLTSTNFVPHHMWSAGIQLVALNWQTFDIGMELNAAMFARAGRCGYVLKPEYLRKKGAEKDKVAALRSTRYRLELEIISAQQLPRPRGSTTDVDAVKMDPFVEVSLFVPGDMNAQKRRTAVVIGNAFNPTFRSPTATASVSPSSTSSLFDFTFSTHPSPGMLDLVFLRFEVLNARGNVKSAVEEGKGESVGAYTIALGALMPGYRHIPLYDSMGDQHLFATLFLRSHVTPLDKPISGLSAESTLSAGLPTSPPLLLPPARLYSNEWVKDVESLRMGKEEQLPTVAAPAADLTPSSSAAADLKKTSYHRRLAALALLLPLAFFLSFPRDLLSTGVGCHHSKFGHSEIAKCPSQPAPRSVGADWNPAGDAEYKKLAVQRFSGAIQVPTESHDDFGTPDDDSRLDKFADLHKYLESTFPRVYSTLQVEKVQKYGLLMTWKAKERDDGVKRRKPIVLMAHQDVVPVNPETVNDWAHPPFSGELDEEGYVWGRGAADCKNTLIGILAALDKLIEEGFQPERDIIFSSGFDEEISGWRSAQPLAEAIEARYGKNGVAFVLDEGFGGIKNIYDKTFALFAIAEKGAISLKLDVSTPGGHASMPEAHTTIGVLAELIHALEQHPDHPKIRPSSPLLAELQCYAEYGNVDKKWKKQLRSPKQWPKLAQELSREASSRSSLMTTQAVDLISGGVKINALPETATASINYRIEYSSSVEATTSRIRSVLEPVVQRLNLTFDAYGSHADVKNNVVHLSVVKDSEIEPAPQTPTEGAVWDMVAGTTRHVWSDAIAAPTGMMANTDTKYSWNLTSSIYRFLPGRLDEIKDFHTVNERAHIDAHLSGIRFFYKLIRNTEGWEAE